MKTQPTNCRSLCILLLFLMGCAPPTLISPSPVTISPSPIPCSISNLGWLEYVESKFSSTINVAPVSETNCAFKSSFTLKKGEWVAAYKKLDPNLLLNSQGMRFSYSGIGVANTLEFKLIEKDANANETIFYAEWDGATFTQGKRVQDIYYPDMICRYTQKSRCLTGAEHIKPELVDRIDFSFSNKSNQLPGDGEVTIDWVQIIH